MRDPLSDPSGDPRNPVLNPTGGSSRKLVSAPRSETTRNWRAGSQGSGRRSGGPSGERCGRQAATKPQKQPNDLRNEKTSRQKPPWPVLEILFAAVLGMDDEAGMDDEVRMNEGRRNG